MDIIYSMAFGLDIDSKNNLQNEVVKLGNTIISKFSALPSWRLLANRTYNFHWKIIYRYLFPFNIQTVQMVYINMLCDIYVGNCLSVMFPELAKYFNTSLLDRDDVANFSKSVEKAINERENAESVISHKMLFLFVRHIADSQC